MKKKLILFLPLILMVTHILYSQQAGQSTIIYSDKAAGFYIHAIQEKVITSGNCSKPVTYRVFTKGRCPANTVFKWTSTYYNCKGNEEHFPLQISVRKGESGFILSKSLKTRKIISFTDEPVLASVVQPPADFRIEGRQSIPEGERTTLNVSTGNQRSGIKWLWYEQGNKKIIGEGPVLEIQPMVSTTYQVRASLEGFLYGPQQFTVNVRLKPTPPGEFEITGESSMLEGYETEMAIRTTEPREDVLWKWYRAGNVNHFATGTRQKLSPKETTKYEVQGELNGKKSPIKSFSVVVKKTPPPPSDFYITGPSKIREGESAVLKVIPGPDQENVVWQWFRQTDPQHIYTGDSLKISGNESMTWQLVAVRYKKKSAPKSFSVEVIISARMPLIEGKTSTCKSSGEKEIFTVKGGRLGTGSSSWEWYEGRKGAGQLIGKGNKVEIAVPAKRAQYYVHPDGNPDVYAEFSIERFDAAQLPDEIIVPGLICTGDNIVLRQSGGKLNDQEKWVWYNQPLNNDLRIKIGEGNAVTVQASSVAKYTIRAEGGFCEPGPGFTTIINPETPITYTGAIEMNHLNRRKVQLKATRVPANAPYTINWYAGECGKNKIGSGISIEYRLTRKLRQVYMRAESKCDSLYCRSVNLRKTQRPSRNYLFLNLGATYSFEGNFSGVMGTLGIRHFYVRAKLSLNQLLKDINRNGYNSVPQYEYENGTLTDFNQSGTSYYINNGYTENRHTAYTIGLKFGSEKLGYYFGGGYGKRDLLWGFDFYSRTSNEFQHKSLALNKAESLTGPEGEAGIFIKLGGFNLMTGASYLYSTVDQRQYIEGHIGIGFSFNLK